jgi:hypothetical protein
VHHYHATGSYLGPPRIEVMFHSLVGVHAVNMQQIDLAVFKACSRLVKRHAEEFREAWIVLLCVRIYFAKDFIAVGTRMHIASPGVDGKSPAIHSGFNDRLAEREERFAGMSSQFDENRRVKSRNQVARKRNMAGPVTDSVRLVTMRSKLQRRAIQQERSRQFRVESNTRLFARPLHQRPRNVMRLASTIGCTGTA